MVSRNSVIGDDKFVRPLDRARQKAWFAFTVLVAGSRQSTRRRRRILRGCVKQVYVALRERNHDVVFTERLIDRHVQLMEDS